MMNRIICLLILNAMAADSVRACMAIPTPGSCVVRGLKKTEKLGANKYRIRNLRKRIRSEKRLFIPEIESIANGTGKTNLDYIADAALKKRATEGTPIAFAKRFESLRPKLSDAEWSKGVDAWANYIARSEDLWESKTVYEFCGIQDEKSSLKIDAGFIFAWPFILYDFAPNDDKSVALGQGVIVGPVSMTLGVVGLGADVVTFIPSAAVGAERKLRNSIHVKLSSHAFKEFADLVVRYEKTHA